MKVYISFIYVLLKAERQAFPLLSFVRPSSFNIHSQLDSGSKEGSEHVGVDKTKEYKVLYILISTIKPQDQKGQDQRALDGFA
jgi:hypothetical protein